MHRPFSAAILTCLLIDFPLGALAREAIDFKRDIQPILQEQCVECHGTQEQNGGLRFDDPQSIIAEADSGARAVVPGSPQASELLKRVTSTDEDERMPPEGERLSEDQIERLRNWIANGALGLESEVASPAAKVSSTHWSFQPIADPQPPAIGDESWPRNPIDRFIQARREAAGLSVAPDADPGVLLRRAYYGLTGLPPTPEAVAEFLREAATASDSKAAFAELVDRLLNSPSYGERWGRHWMDWVRYADTAGDNSDYPIPQAYLYRNYIIDAFNSDLPYDRFITEQIAGDLLPAETQEQRNRQTIATGYLAMARRFGSLVERYPWHLTIEDSIDNMGRTMLGLSIACARCHDHKFDPISARDYYGLYGILASTQYPFPGLELFKAQRDFVPLIAPPEAEEAMRPYQAETDKLAAELERLLTASKEKSLENAAKEGHASLAELRRMGDELDSLLLSARRAGEKLADHLKKIPAIPTAYAVQDRKPTNARIQIKGEPDRPGAEVPRKFPDILGGQLLPDDVAVSESGRLQLASWIASSQNPLTARVIVNRVWQRHFGRGLVPSTSDFGLRGESPTHPQLLDWLSSEFIRSGWSIKQLHRLIMNSRTYQLASQDVEGNLTRDPGNQFYWKFNRQRLDAESIRDTLLLVGGTLDTAPQAAPHPIPPRESWAFTQHHPYKDDYESNKRSVYIMTKRLTAKPYFQTFDGADPNVCTSDRDESVTALQALYFVNDEFLHQQAESFAEQLLRQSATEEERLNLAFTTILCRQPAADESALILRYFNSVRQRLASDPQGEHQAWSSLARSLLRLNEFLYLD